MKCKHCDKELNARQTRDGLKFCSRSCSNSAVPRISSDQSRKKLSSTMKKKVTLPRDESGLIVRDCVACDSTFVVDSALRRKKTCSPACLSQIRSKAAAKGVCTKRQRGTLTGWQVRTKQPSYAEAYFISMLEAEKIEGWQREVKFGKWFADFSFQDKKIVVEIDGRQHSDRVESDRQKDAFITSLGWKVIRIRWANPATDRGRAILYPQLQQVKSLIK